jgi:membrane peptidoglycan carboxypeptidase
VIDTYPVVVSSPAPGGAAAVFGRLGLLAVATALCGVLVAGVALPIVAGLGKAAVAASENFENLPSVLKTPLLPQQTTLLSSDGKVIATLYTQNRIIVPLADMSPMLQTAIISIEDSRFYQHGGVDVKGTLRAFLTDVSGGSIQGGSTITQQYVKQVLEATANTPAQQEAAAARTPARKIREMRLALGLEQIWTKSQILEGYLNIVYFGGGAYGCEAAAEHYFSTTCKNLTLPQAATLAGIVQSPSNYDPISDPQLSQQRRDIVLQRERQLNNITEAQFQAAVAVPMAKELHPSQRANGCANSTAPYFCNYVLQQLKNDPAFGSDLLSNGGYRIYTTLSSSAQQIAEKALEKKVPMTDRHGAAISVVSPGTGNIVAMAQNRIWGVGKGNQYTTYNYNTDVGFQVGSTMKIFVLAAALEKKIPVSLTLYAPPKYKVTDYTNCAGPTGSNDLIGNEEGGAGTYNMLTATAQSVNTYFLQLEKKTGICLPAQIATAMGITLANGTTMNPTDLNELQNIQVPDFTLGVNPIPPLKMAAAYAGFANHGMYCAPRALVSITQIGTGKKIPVPAPRCNQAVPAKIADGVTAILKGVINGPDPGRTGAGMSLGRPAAGKTGTTDNHTNVWFDGYVPQLAAAAWVGDPTGSNNAAKWSMSDVTIGGHTYQPAFGLNLPGPIWRDVMSQLVADLPVVLFTPPDPSVIGGLTTKVPDVSGMTLQAAMAALAAAGFTGQYGTPMNCAISINLVCTTTPAAGTSVGSGSQIAINVSNGKPPTPTTTPAPGGSPGTKPSGSPSPNPTASHAATPG